MAWPILGLVVCLVLLGGTAQGLQLHLRRNNLPVSNSPRGLVSRAAGGLSLDNSADISYYANITLGDQNFKVLIDTGRYLFSIFAHVLRSENSLSSDLWIAGKVVESNSTGVNASIKYAVNSVTGALCCLGIHRACRLTD